MKPERARELYTDYAEGTLSPALKQALEQHFEADTDAKADFQQFLQVYALLDATEARAEVEVPLGFRAKVLELAAEEQARREAAPGRRAALTMTGWFQSWGHRRQASAGFAVALGVAALAGVVIHGVNTGPTTGEVINPPPVFSSIPTTITGVTTDSQADGSSRNVFHIHLPRSVRQATVSAYVITATDQITDDATRERDATKALSQPMTLANNAEMQIPVSLLQQPPAGHTLNLFVKWMPDDPNQPSGEQVVFTPVGPAGTSDATPDPTGLHFYDALQNIAASYGATVIADATTANLAVNPPSATGDPKQALTDIARQVGYKVAALDNNTFEVYK